jgi:DNA mismatch endonuclease (patch repair protein)
MAAIRGKDTKPERIVRSALHAAGLRYRLHSRTLEGKPDLVLRQWRAVVQIYGCFWHKHDCTYFRMPATRTEFWAAKLAGNRARDRRTERRLRAQGWRVARVWECAIRDANEEQVARMVIRLVAWIRNPRRPTIDIRGRP